MGLINVRRFSSHSMDGIYRRYFPDGTFKFSNSPISNYFLQPYNLLCYFSYAEAFAKNFFRLVFVSGGIFKFSN